MIGHKMVPFLSMDMVLSRQILKQMFLPFLCRINASAIVLNSTSIQQINYY